jgi:hypothetical protein
MLRLAVAGAILCSLLLAQSAFAGPSSHLRTPALDVGGLDHACGVAVDSKGDLYVSSAGESEIEVFSPAHALLTTIANNHEPCGLAVDTNGNLYVSEKATGEVVRYAPSPSYPPTAGTTYTEAAIDTSGNAKGIAVDPTDNRLYAAESNRISTYDSSGALGINEVQRVRVFEATGGTFRLKFGGEETGPLSYQALGSEVKAALEGLASIGPGNVEVEETATSTYFITFTGSLGHTDVEALTGDSSGLTGTGGQTVLISEQVKGWGGRIGEGELTEATGVAIFTSPTGDRRLFVADGRGPAADELLFLGGSTLPDLKLRRAVTGSATPDGSFEFGIAGAYLAVDSGNKEATGNKCVVVGEQACTAGHVLIYDAGHGALDEFEASGEYLDQMKDPGFVDAEPSGMAVDRAGGASDGTIYITSGAGPGAKVLAFAPLVQPSRLLLKPPLSHVLENARSVATDSHGDVYVGAGSFIHVFRPDGSEIKVGFEGKGIEDTHAPLFDLAVDSEGHLYVEEQEKTVTYYTPSKYPPLDGTTYVRHEPPLTTSEDFPAGSKSLRGIAVNPGPGAGVDRIFVASANIIREYDTIKNGSGVLNPSFGGSLGITNPNASIAVEGPSARNNGKTTVYVALGGFSTVAAANALGTEIVARLDGSGCPQGHWGVSPRLAVDQANGHVLEFQPADEAAREYDGAGACVAEFGRFTSLSAGYRIAVDSACAAHVNETTGEEEPLDETTTPTCHEYDPANGNVYIAFDDTAPESFDVTTFGPLNYGEAPSAVTDTPSEVDNGGATLNGTLNPNGVETSGCEFEYLEEGKYLSNGETFSGAIAMPCAESAGEIGSGTKPVPVHARVSLDTEIHYCTRLVASNKFGSREGEAVCFGPPELLKVEAPEPIGYAEATLRAEIAPSGLPTTYRFEYGLAEGEYEHVTPSQLIAPDAGSSEIHDLITGLAEGIEYHFRVLLENEAKAIEGPDQVFTTLARRGAEACPNGEYRTGASSQLPDCRAYELVTPAQTNGFFVFAPGHESAPTAFDGWLTQPRGSAAGESFSYYVNGTLPGFDGNGVLDGYRAVRSAGEHPTGGWQSQLFSPTYREADPGFTHTLGSEGRSPDQLYSLWSISVEEPIAELPNGIYLRVPDGAANAQCLQAPLPSHLNFELLGCGTRGTDSFATGQHIGTGGNHVIFSSAARLESNAPAVGTMAVYDRAAGSAQAEVVSVKSGGSAFGAGEDATYLGTNETGDAISFSVAGKLYEHRGGATVEIAESPFAFAGISEDGKRVFYVASANGTAAAPLFACNTEAGSCAGAGAHAPTRLGPPGSEGIFANVSADGSHVFFSSEEDLTGSEINENCEEPSAGELSCEEAEPGAHNLYSFDLATETTKFVARLTSADFQIAAFAGISGMNLAAWTPATQPNPDGGRAFAPTRSTPDGSVLVFQSHARLTAYENEGIGEIYRYDPSAPAGEQLTCPSCDPRGTPPSTDALLEDLRTTENALTTAHDLIPNLTDDGSEVVFTSAARLLPEDANSAIDVYEWRAQGSTWGSIPGAPHCERPGGCLALVSSGQGERDSLLFGMSADGRDIFLRTLEPLVRADVTGSFSIYDAREGGGIPEPPEEEVCNGDACQPAGPEPPVLPAPASSGSEGGNAPRRACPRGRHRVKGRCVKRRHSKRHRHHSHRLRRVTR